MKNLKKNFDSINHKELWLNSMIGMTWGFLATLVVGTIVGLFGIHQDSSFSHFINNIKGALTYITPFGIGIGIAIKAGLSPLQTFAVGIGAFIVGQSLFVPAYSSNGIGWTDVKIGIFVPKETLGKIVFKPGDVFGAWIASVTWVYIFSLLKWNTFIDIILVPLFGVLIGFIESFTITYVTSTIFVLLEWMIEHTINKKRWEAILLAPILGILMGLALSLPTSSAAIAFQLYLKGDAATAAIAATAGQMISFGILTYMSTKSITKSVAVSFGSSMLQMNNFMKKPKLLLIPSIVSGMSALLSVSIVPLAFTAQSVTSGMGTAAMYGQIFTLEENGWSNMYSWINVIFMQLLIPVILTILMGYIAINKFGLINSKDMEINHA